MARKRRNKPATDAAEAQNLIERCICGDETAWRGFVRLYTPLIKAPINHILSRGEDRHDIEVDDVVQNVYLRLLKNNRRPLRNFDPACAGLPTYLSQIARSTTLDALKRPHLATEPLDDQSYQRQPQLTTHAMSAMPLHILSPRERVVIELMYLKHLSVREIAERLQIAEVTVRVTKWKAIRKMRARCSP